MAKKQDKRIEEPTWVKDPEVTLARRVADLLLQEAIELIEAELKGNK
ncbi:MAG TPA: hypothetical protein VFQ72_02270 [Candidatus Paceibacterota bacterium]|nr:hypothetical protein [Candidatus Paceibacterota bacterium]